MSSEPSVPKCPQCGAAIPADAPQGLCPRCVLLGAATSTEAGKPVLRTEPPAPNALRAAFPQLEILELIGRGGMGFVYRAKQAKLDRLVALKLLPVELGADPHFAERFNREARALARLNHPGIVAVYDFGVSGGFCYLLMEFVDGVNLRQAMQAGRFTQRESLALVPKICEAIQFAHEQGVLHRDIKPENILLDTHGRVKIADFGIAKLVGEDTPDLTLTLSGARLGTPSYMAPEQVEHPGTVDHRADIYSLGVVFYELLTGELPLGRFAPPSAKADLDARVDDIVMRALAKERELRQQSAGEVKTQVETVSASPRPSSESARPRTDTSTMPSWSAQKWLGSGLLILAGVLGAILLLVVGTTGMAIMSGRGTIQAIELLIFLLATGVAFASWRFGRRLYDHSAVPVPTAELPERPFLFASVPSRWKPWLLAALGLAGALLTLQAVVTLPSPVWSMLHTTRAGPLPFLLMTLTGCGLLTLGWHGAQRRHELLRSLGLHVADGAPELDRWLGRAALLLLAGLAGGMLVGLASLLLVLLSLLGNEAGNGLLSVVAVLAVIGFVAAWMRHGADTPGTRLVPHPAPAWVSRTAWWFLAIGGIALLPTLVSLGSSVRVWHRASLLLFTGFALLSLNPGLRRLALVVNWFGLFSGLGGSLALLWLGSRHELPEGISIGVPGITTRPGMALLIGLLETGAFAAGLLALHRVDARAAFGVVAYTGWRRWLGRAGVAVFLVAMVGLQLIVAKQAARSVGPQNDAVARLREIPAGGDRAWLTLNPPADLPLRFTVTVWSNGVAHPVATNEQVFATYSRPVQVQLTRAIRPGEDGANWEVSDHSELDAEGEETWLPSGIPLSVVLQAVNTGATVQLSAGDRLRRWLFLPPFEASQFSATASLPQPPAWGVSVDLEIVQDTEKASSSQEPDSTPRSAAGADSQQHLTGPLQPPAKLTLQGFQAFDANVLIWSNGVPIPARGMVSSVREPGEWGKSAVNFEFRLERESSPNQLRLSCKTEGGRSAVSVPVPIPAEPALLALSNAQPHGPMTNGHLRHWLFLPAEAATAAADQGVAPETALWGVSIDVPVPVPVPDPPGETVIEAQARRQQFEQEMKPRLKHLLATAALTELKRRGVEGGEVLGLDIHEAERLVAEAEAAMAKSPAGNPLPEPTDPTLRNKQDIQIGLAQATLEDVRGRLAVGAVSPLEVAAAERDLAVAEARGDAVAIARANQKYAALALEAARKQFEVGKLTTLELHGYEATNRITEVELKAALQNSGNPAAARTNTTSSAFQARLAAIWLDFAQQKLAELRKQAEVGAVAPAGMEMLGAELAVAVAEAELKGDAMAAAKARLNHAEKILAIVERMFGVGKAMAAEVSEAKLAVAEATAGVAKLERGP